MGQGSLLAAEGLVVCAQGLDSRRLGCPGCTALAAAPVVGRIARLELRGRKEGGDVFLVGFIVLLRSATTVSSTFQLVSLHGLLLGSWQRCGCWWAPKFIESKGFRSPANASRCREIVVVWARSLSDNIILMPGQNFSVAPFFLRGLSQIIMRHAVRIHAMVARVTQELDVIFVDLFHEPAAQVFVREPKRYYCPDGLHPSGDGYGIWFAVLMASVPLAQFLGRGNGGAD